MSKIDITRKTGKFVPRKIEIYQNGLVYLHGTFSEGNIFSVRVKDMEWFLKTIRSSSRIKYRCMEDMSENKVVVDDTNPLKSIIQSLKGDIISIKVDGVSTTGKIVGIGEQEYTVLNNRQIVKTVNLIILNSKTGRIESHSLNTISEFDFVSNNDNIDKHLVDTKLNSENSVVDVKFVDLSFPTKGKELKIAFGLKTNVPYKTLYTLKLSKKKKDDRKLILEFIVSNNTDYDWNDTDLFIVPHKPHVEYTNLYDKSFIKKKSQPPNDSVVRMKKMVHKEQTKDDKDDQGWSNHSKNAFKIVQTLKRNTSTKFVYKKYDIEVVKYLRYFDTYGRNSVDPSFMTKGVVIQSKTSIPLPGVVIIVNHNDQYMGESKVSNVPLAKDVELLYAEDTSCKFTKKLLKKQKIAVSNYQKNDMLIIKSRIVKLVEYKCEWDRIGDGVRSWIKIDDEFEGDNGQVKNISSDDVKYTVNNDKYTFEVAFKGKEQKFEVEIEYYKSKTITLGSTHAAEKYINTIKNMSDVKRLLNLNKFYRKKNDLLLLDQ